MHNGDCTNYRTDIVAGSCCTSAMNIVLRVLPSDVSQASKHARALHYFCALHYWKHYHCDPNIYTSGAHAALCHCNQAVLPAIRTGTVGMMSQSWETDVYAAVAADDY
jgi:hypothetical protein